MVLRPRATLAAVVDRPAWVATWAVILVAWGLCGGWLLATDVGQQALVDERVRVVEGLGGSISDAEYAALQRNPPWWVYFASGGRALLAPPVTLAVALALAGAARSEGAKASWAQALSVAVHASVVLALGQLIATPFHYVRESLTSPLNLAAFLPLMEEGSVPSRFFGTVDVFSVWWAGLLAVGLSRLTSRRTSRYIWPILAVYLGFAAIVAVVTVVAGGS